MVHTSSTTFAQNLKRLRKQHNLTMKQLASYIDVSQSKISKLENEQISPHIEDIINIANYFNISTDELLGKTKKQLWEDIDEYNTKVLNESFNENFRVLFEDLKILTDTELEYIQYAVDILKKKGNKK